MAKFIPMPNTPVNVRVLTPEGAPAPSQNPAWPAQVLFQTDKGDWYLAQAPAQMLREAIAQHGAAVCVSKSVTAIGNGRTQTRWSFTPAVDEAPQANGNGTLSVPRIAPQAAPAAQATPARPQWAEHLLTQTNALTDVLAEALRHSSKHGGVVKSEDVRSLLLSAFINLSKGAMSHAA